MKLSVIILNYNVRYFLELCVKSVQEAIKNLDAEIIVVDNQSSDGSCEMVEALFPDVTLIKNTDNVGFSKGNNIGVERAKGEYVCILNPDTVVPENVFSSLLDFSGDLPNLGIVGCRLIDGTGKFLPESKRNVPKPKVALKKLLGNPDLYYTTEIDEHSIGKAPIFVGAFMLLKKAVYQEVGGFDEDYFMYGEDVDLSYKILKAGYDNYYNGKVTCIHYKGESTLKDVKYAKRFYGAMQIFYKKHFKSNIVFNTVVWLGIRGAYLTRSKPTALKNNIERYLLISNKNLKPLQNVLNQPVTVASNILEVKNNTEIIFDANLLTYKAIIDHISELEINKTVKFKILPKNATFIIGSNSSENRGEIILFNNN